MHPGGNQSPGNGRPQKLTEHKWYPVKRRTRKPKPTLHRFYCLHCGLPIEEWSDPRDTRQLCAGCLRVQAYIDGIELSPPPQTPLPRDWWADWCIWYETHKSEIWQDIPTVLRALGGKK